MKMKYKKIMILTFILAFLLAISAVSAADNATDDIVSADVSDDVVGVENKNETVVASEGQNDEVMTSDSDERSIVGVNEIDDNKLSSENSVSKKTFDGIQTAINAASTSDVIKLSGTYYGSGEKITIQKKITLMGEGETILDAKGLSKILEISASHVVIENIKFINGYDRYVGGGIFCTGGSEYVTLKNCIFSNNTSINGGSHIYWAGNYGKLVRCNFIGKNVYWNGNQANIQNSIFTNAFLDFDSYQGSVTNCIFNNTDNYHSISSRFETPISGCTFINCQDKEFILLHYNIANCKFYDSTSLYASNINTTQGLSQELIVTLKDVKGNPLNAKNIIINVGNISEERITDSNGQASIDVSQLEPNTYIATIQFKGDNSYLGSKKQVTVEVKNPTSEITANAKTFKTADKTKKFTVTLTNNKKLINGATVKITVNKKTYTAKTNKNGVATFKLTKLTKEGTYKATISFAGKGNYTKTSTKVVLTVSKAKPKLTANDKTFKFNDKTKKYALTLKTDKNKAMKNTKVTLKVNGKTYTAKTNSKGVATFKLLKLTKEGTFNTTIKFAGSKNYKSISKNVKISVKKPITSKSVTLDVIYSDDTFPRVELDNKDVIETTYEKYSGRQWPPGVYAKVTYGVGLIEAKHTKLVKCTVWFKNSDGDEITKTSTNFQYNMYIKVDLESGYTPYKAQIWYENK